MPRVEFDGERVQLAARIPRTLHHAIRLAAIDEEVTVREWVADALEAHLRRCQPRATSEPTRGEST
jgi:predicted HicB family RNase H-like nuclease